MAKLFMGSAPFLARMLLWLLAVLKTDTMPWDNATVIIARVHAITVSVIAKLVAPFLAVAADIIVIRWFREIFQVIQLLW